MSFDLLSLPRNSIVKIFSFLSKKTVFQMRMLNKSTKNIVDSSLLALERTFFESFTVEPKGDNESTIVLSFRNGKQWLLWKIFFESIMNNSENNYFEIEFDKKTDLIFKFIKVSIENDNVQRFLEFVHPLFNRVCIRILKMWNGEPEFYRTFLQKIYFAVIEIDSTVNIYPWIDIIKNYEKFTFHVVQFSSDCVKPILEIANFAESIQIIVKRKSDMRFDYIPLFRAIVMRKCDKLHIREEYENRTISSTDIQQLVKIFHQINRKILLTAGTCADMMNNNFGLYNIKTSDITGYRFLAIKHVEIRHAIDRL